MLEVLYEECSDQAVKVMTKALHVWAEDAAETFNTGVNGNASKA